MFFAGKNMSISEDDLKDVSTALLFGNFDENGRLENDIFDSTEQKHLASLSKYVIFSVIIYCKLL